ncbi:hypothetical protein ISU10_18490 [Nocardioides agariphilus]|uniref:Uncharacterized protein n=1 Tax=Nocardioides agariphilus TaxID=433664 RepID=A0A930VRQ0_9ACTN|nr:hypothetical protein [Nocardioides agariphilus]MBF4769763.1 hypothetical protein [Nocardioides agariphilus]
MAANNTLQRVTIANGPAPYIGWALVDQLGRGMAGAEPSDWGLPGQIIDSTNLGSCTEAEIYPEFDGFESVFTKAWGM